MWSAAGLRCPCDGGRGESPDRHLRGVYVTLLREQHPPGGAKPGTGGAAGGGACRQPPGGERRSRPRGALRPGGRYALALRRSAQSPLFAKAEARAQPLLAVASRSAEAGILRRMAGRILACAPNDPRPLDDEAIERVVLQRGKLSPLLCPFPARPSVGRPPARPLGRCSTPAPEAVSRKAPPSVSLFTAAPSPAP